MLCTNHTNAHVPTRTCARRYTDSSAHTRISAHSSAHTRISASTCALPCAFSLHEMDMYKFHIYISRLHLFSRTRMFTHARTHLCNPSSRSDTTGNAVIDDVCRVATNAFKQNHLNMRAFEMGLINMLCAAFILGGRPAYFPLFSLAQVCVCAGAWIWVRALGLNIFNHMGCSSVSQMDPHLEYKLL